MQRSHSIRVAGAIAATLLVGGSLSSCAADAAGTPSSGTSGGGTIKIGVSESITADLATYGIAERQGIRIAIDDANAAGGVNGKKLEMVFYDPAGDTATGVEQVNRMIQQDGVDIVVGGGSSSGVALAMKPILQSAGIAFVAAEAADAITDPVSEAPMTFSTCISTDIVAAKMMKYLKQKKITSIGVLSSTDSYGASGAASLQSAAKASGISVKAVTYDPTATDLTTQLRSVASSNPGAIINWTSGASGIVYFQNAKTLGLDGKTQIMSSFTFSNPALMKQAGDSSVGAVVAGVKATLLSTLPDSDPDKATLKAFNTALESKYKVPVTIYAAEAHDAALVAIQAMKNAHSTDGKAVSKAIESLKLQGTQGTYNFSATNHRGLGTNNLVMMKWDGSKFVPTGATS